MYDKSVTHSYLQKDSTQTLSKSRPRLQLSKNKLRCWGGTNITQSSTRGYDLGELIHVVNYVPGTVGGEEDSVCPCLGKVGPFL